MGGGKGGGSGHTPVEQPDTLKSRQRAQIVDLVCEGPILGPVAGLESVYLNDTPIENEDGRYNFSGVDIAWREGHQVQDPLPGIAAVETEVGVNVEVTYSQPLVRTVTNPDVDRVRVTIGVPSLVYMSSNGDRRGTSVNLRIEVGVDGAWSLAKDVNITGKTTSPYTESHIIWRPSSATGNWQIRVTRLTADSDTDRKQNKTNWYSYTEIIDAKLTYPNSAVVGMRFDSDQFQSIPRRNYHIYGLIVQVPSNYDPDTREYSGIWNGSFKPAWTNNPAWILYDLLTNRRYGMGRAMVGFEPDKWRLYEVAQYCDQLVDDGFGGTEPRFALNCYIADQRQAHQVISDIVSVFRGMPVWDGLQLSVNQDRPQDSVWQFNNTNVVNGRFRYQSSARKARHTAVQVEYVDQANGWEKQTEYVQDDDLVARYGLNLKKVTAFGCTSRGQARRVGQWILITEKLERQSVTFEVGREGLVCLPGDVIDTIDNQYAGTRLGGRVLAVVDNVVTLDAPITLTAGQANWFHYLDGNSQLQQLQVFSPAEGTTSTLVLGDAPDGLRSMDTYNISTASLSPRKWRVLGISENREAGTYAISALHHVPEKHAIIEQGLVFDPPDNTLLGGRLPPVEHLRADLLPESDSAQVRLTWSTPRVLAGILFDVRLLLDGRQVERATVDTTEYRISGIEQGDYTVEIRAKNRAGQLGPVTDLVFTVAPPRAPDSLGFSPTNFSITVRPLFDFEANSLGTTYEFYGGASQAEVEAQTHYLGRGFILDQQGLTPDTTYWYGVVAVNAVGRSAMTVGSSKTLLKPEDILQLIGPEIPNLDWAVELQELVDTNSAGLILLSDRAALVVNQDSRVTGMTVTAGSQATAIDFLSDFVSFTDPDTLERNLYWDNALKTLVLKGQIRLLDGTVVSDQEDIRAYDGDTIYTEFQYSVNGSSSWHSPMAEGDVYVRSRVVTNGTPGSWSAAARIKGDQGTNGSTIYTEFQYSVNGSTSWHAPMAEGDVYIRSRVVTNGSPGAWSNAARIKGDQGIQGNPGVAGSGIYRLETATGVFPSDTATANSLFSGYVGRPPVQDDVLTVYATDGGVLTNADSRMYNGSTWVTPKLFVDGDVIALGSIRGDRLVAGTEITAPRILAGEVIGSRFVTSEDTSPRVELDPASTWPLWIGSGNKTLENAKLSLDNAGNLAAANLTAHNTTLSGTLSVPNGIIKKAMIGTAEIDTLRLAGQSVTIPLSVYISGPISDNGTTPVTLASGTISEGSANLYVSGACDIDLTQTGGDNSPAVYAHLEVWVDGVVRISRRTSGNSPIEFSLAVGSGSHSIQLRAWVGGSGYASFSKRSLFALLTKR